MNFDQKVNSNEKISEEKDKDAMHPQGMWIIPLRV